MKNKAKIKKLVKELLKESNKAMINNIDKVLNSGCLDVEDWNENNNPMILPKSILIALLEYEIEQYSSKGTCFEKQINKEVKNIKYFL